MLEVDCDVDRVTALSATASLSAASVEGGVGASKLSSEGVFSDADAALENGFHIGHVRSKSNDMHECQFSNNMN